MASIAAQKVAEEVLESISKGKLPSVTKIAVKKGYKPTTARSGQIQKTKTFQRVVGHTLERFENERMAIFDEMEKKRVKAPYASLVGGLDVTSKNIQLLSGGATENIAIGVKRLKDDELAHIAEGG